ncbi:MAG: RNA pseudouridine synthase [Pirellulaceae bacterium]|nr:RNA pseudouridine synthase [Pirellulaceae bacterium]
MKMPGFSILYEEGPCLVVSKPSGVLTQAPPGIDSLESRIKTFLIERDQKPGRAYLGVPHRLDRPVSGVMVFAKHIRACRRIAEQFEGRIVEKTYWAVVEGIVQDEKGTWSDKIRKIPGQAHSEIVPPDHPEGRSATLHFRVLSRLGRRTVLEIQLETGRTHQIRVQAAERGFPILGDFQYGANDCFGEPTTSPRDRWIALHSQSISLRHPMTRERIVVSAPVSDPWQPFLLNVAVDNP